MIRLTIRRSLFHQKVSERKSISKPEMIGGNNFISIQLRNQWTGRFWKSNCPKSTISRKKSKRISKIQTRKRWIDYPWRWSQGQFSKGWSRKETNMDCWPSGFFQTTPNSTTLKLLHWNYHIEMTKLFQHPIFHKSYILGLPN